ncbi:MAG: hypothetical protein GY913_30895 [Proteobacteria bacterium]|nr:hypothetical protein [Pseudomonadota bacterium]MCP4921325.1 hypothetical protein [Pseudomonadota bacterium]
MRFWFRADSPHAWLLALALPGFLDRYDVELSCHVIAPPDREAVSQPGNYAAWALRDAAELAQAYGLEIPTHPPDPSSVAAAHGQLVGLDGRAFLDKAAELGATLFSGGTLTGSGPDQAVLDANLDRLHGEGHYLPGVLTYAGQQYWNVGRLASLEDRLAGFSAGSGNTIEPVALRPLTGTRLEVWLSARSPYSYLAIDRIGELVQRHDLELVVHPILPMVMRGVPAPRRKRMALLFDAAREARRHDIPFGRICDPLGGGVERVLAAYTLTGDRGFEYLQAALHGIWGEGLEVKSDAGMRALTEPFGLDWAAVQASFEAPDWQQMVEENRLLLVDLGLWGVPSFRLTGPDTDWSTWGQDRLWILDGRLAASENA